MILPLTYYQSYNIAKALTVLIFIKNLFKYKKLSFITNINSILFVYML